MHVCKSVCVYSICIHLDVCASRPRWVVPVLPKGELEVLLEAAIDLSKKGKNVIDRNLCCVFVLTFGYVLVWEHISHVFY